MKRPPFLSRVGEHNPGGAQIVTGPHAWRVAKQGWEHRIVVPVPPDSDPARMRWSEWAGRDVLCWDTGSTLEALDTTAAALLEQGVRMVIAYSLHDLRHLATYEPASI